MARQMLAVIGVVLGLLLCVHNVAAQTSGGQAQMSDLKAERYVCEMHPDGLLAKSGNCLKEKRAIRRVQDEGSSASEAPSTLNDAMRVHDRKHNALASSLHIPNVPVRDQDGKRLTFYTDLVQGKTVAINFIFTTCTTICPLSAATFTRVQWELRERVGRDVYLISISVDPVTDTPPRLKAWGEKFQVGQGWTLVTGSRPVIDRLLNALAASVAN
jgi:hypothetical protein